MNQWAVLKITNGTVTIDLLSGNFRLRAWPPAIAVPKGDGVWNDSPLADGRRLVFRKVGNVVETFDLSVGGSDQNEVIQATQDIRRLLESALQYWIGDGVTVAPVWIEARAACETSSRYAYIYDYRAPSDEDPYGATFIPTALPNPAFARWPLYLERGYWLSTPPGSMTCVQMGNLASAYRYEANLILNDSFETAGGGGVDVFANWSESAGDGTITQDATQYYLGTKSAKFVSGPLTNSQLSQDIAVVAGATYAISFFVRGTAGHQVNTQVYDVTHGVNFAQNNFYLHETNVWEKDTFIVTAPSGCVTMRLILKCANTNGATLYCDLVSIRRIYAHDFGKTAACPTTRSLPLPPLNAIAVDVPWSEVFTTNHAQKAQLTHIYAYDASAGTFGSNLLLSALPYNLTPGGVDINDCTYFGIFAGAYHAGPFSNLVFDLTPSASAFVDEWEYWNGAAWVTITNILDGTENSHGFNSGTIGYGLTQSGACCVSWAPPANWALTTVNGVYGYWVRGRYTLASVSNIQQKNRHVYTAVNPYYSVAADQVKGDVPALARLQVNGISDGSSPFKQSDAFIYARSDALGARFNPCLNLSWVQQESEVSLALSAATLTYYMDAQSPAGQNVRYTAVGAGNATVTMTIISPLCDDYFGTFRVFLRAKQTGGSVADMSAELSVISTSPALGPRAYTTAAGSLLMMDLGQFTIPNRNPGSRGFESIKFALTVYCSNVAGGTFDLYDLILIPIDEAVAQALASSTYAYAAFARAISLDSIDPNTILNALTVVTVTGNIIAEGGYNTINRDRLRLSNNEAQKIGILYTNQPYHYLVNFSQVSRVDRYLSMRGSR